MKYRMIYQDGEEVTEVHAELEAEGPREALDKVECELLNDSWQYQEDEDGSGSYVDPQRQDRFYQASPLSQECDACGAAVPADDVGLLPAADDDEEWGRLAIYHYMECEWIETRGNQRTA
jgi:hypothetical protein